MGVEWCRVNDLNGLPKESHAILAVFLFGHLIFWMITFTVVGGDLLIAAPLAARKQSGLLFVCVRVCMFSL